MLRGLVLVALATTSWGTAGAVATVLVSRTGIDVFTMGAIRMWIAAVLLLGIAWLAGGALRPSRADLGRCAAMGLCMAIFQLTYFTAVARIGVGLAALVAICSAPLLIALLATVALRERMTAWAAAALVLGVAGAALLVAGPRGASGSRGFAAAGTALALGAGASYALYVVIAKASVARSAPLPMAAYTFVAGALLLTPALWFSRDLARETALGWPLLLYLGGVATAGAYAVYTVGLRHLSAGAAGILALIEPLTATALGVMVFGERLGVSGIAGAALLFVSIGLLVRAQAAPVPALAPQTSPR
jgi:DME family drug/metabolite transporter